MNLHVLKTNETRVPTKAALEAMGEQLARQKAELAAAYARLTAIGGIVEVPRAALEAIDQACLVRTSTLTSAIRG
jgi:predicted metal-dependent RNase